MTTTAARTLSVALLLWGCATSPCAQATEAPPRVVAIGDLHGDLDNALAVLAMAGLIDTQAHWAGGKAVLVQTGDVTDRGPDSRAILDLMRRLQREAPASGGRVVPLLGNHEVMNLTGDWRYVHPGDVEAFGGTDARRAAFAVDGAYGTWLVRQDVVAKVGDAVFVHGGVSPEFAALGVDGINTAARAALTGSGDPAVLGSEGPLWFRGYVQEPEAQICGRLHESLLALGAKRMVVGHTTRRDGRIQVRCDGRLHVIDVGIADAYGGNLAAWEAVGSDARALTPSGPIDLEDPTP